MNSANKRTTGIKLACLLVPLIGTILSLHAWGDGLRTQADRYWMRKKYQEHRRNGFAFRVERGSKIHERAARLARQFVEGALDETGKKLGLADPTHSAIPPLIHLLTTRDDLKPNGFPAETPDLDRSGGTFDPERLAAAVVVGAAEIHQEADETAINHQLVHMMLHAGAPRAAYSPWLLEGLAEHFAGAPPGENGPPPRLSDILRARDATVRSSRLLVEFLIRRYPDEFIAYCEEERRDGPVSPGAFKDVIGSPATIEAEWRRWVSIRDE